MFFLSYYEKNTWKILPSVNDVFPFPLTKVISTQRMQGCCSYRQEVLNVFRYDEKLEGWSFLEDFDLSYRIFKSTSGLLYLNPKAKLIHREHIHMSSSLKAEGYKKIVNRTYMFFKLIKQSPYNYLIFVWGIFGLLLTTILGAMSGKRKERSTWLPIYLIEATFYTLKHLKEIKQLNLQTLENL
jgi:hypothetical protein